MSVLHFDAGIFEELAVLIEDLVVPCCMGFAVHGAYGCTCWEAVLDRVPEQPVAGPMPARAECCHDCAYRNGSPERTGVVDKDMDDIASGQSAFVCHQGMPRVVRWEHPAGFTFTPPTDDYKPLGTTVAYRADGQPASICAGWIAHRKGMGIL